VKASGVGAVAGVTGLAGCGGNSDGGSDTSGTTTGGTSSSGSSETVTIGATLPQTGSLSSSAKLIETGYRLGVEKINENGGIDGKDVELIIRDDESTAKKVRSNLQQIVSNNDVDMLWGSFSSLLVTAGSAYAEQQKLPFLGTTFAYMKPRVEQNYQWTFAPFGTSRDFARATKAWFDSIEDGPQRVAIWELNTGWGAELADYWEEKLGGNGYEIVLREKYELGAKDFSTLISQTQSADADAVLSNPVPPDGITAVKQMKSQGWTPKLVDFIRAFDPTAWHSALGKTGEYVSSTGTGWLPGLDTNGTEELIQRYRDQDGVDSDAVPLNMVGDGYSVTQVAATALRAAGSTENTAIQDALLNETFDTVLGEFGFNEHGMAKEGQLVPAVGQWKDGEQKLVHPNPDGPHTMDTVYPMPDFSER